MVTELQRRLNDARLAADEAADAQRREAQRCQVRELTTIERFGLLVAFSAI